MDNTPVQKVDILMYAGKWYTLYSIPTLMSRNWRQTTETYVIHPDGYYAVFNTYRMPDSDDQKYFRSKLYVVRGSGNAHFKLQAVWPFKLDYLVIELAEDYSYAVVGHPEYKHLSIMSRRPGIDEVLLREIIERCSLKGYDTGRLVDQQHQD